MFPCARGGKARVGEKTGLVDTTVGRIKFDAHGDAEGVGFSVYQVQHGQFVEVQ